MIINIVLVIKLLSLSSKSIILYSCNPEAKTVKTTFVLRQLAPCSVQPVVVFSGTDWKAGEGERESFLPVPLSVI